jgi:hypothetical protein
MLECDKQHRHTILPLFLLLDVVWLNVMKSKRQAYDATTFNDTSENDNQQNSVSKVSWSCTLRLCHSDVQLCFVSLC